MIDHHIDNSRSPCSPSRLQFRLRTLLIAVAFVAVALSAERWIGTITLPFSLGVAGAAAEILACRICGESSRGTMGAFLGGSVGAVLHCYMKPALSVRLLGFPSPEGMVFAGLAAVVFVRILRRLLVFLGVSADEAHRGESEETGQREDPAPDK